MSSRATLRSYLGSRYLTHTLCDIFIGLVVVYWWIWWPEIVSPQLWVLLIPAIVIHRYILFAERTKPMETHSLDLERVLIDRKEGKLKRYEPSLLINHAYIFPILLTLYLVVLLIDQTHVFNLDLRTPYLLIDQSLLLVLVIASGVGTVRGEKRREQYKRTSTSLTMARLYIALAAGLSLIGTRIVMQQVKDLGMIGLVIAILAGVLIRMVGMMLREEE